MTEVLPPENQAYFAPKPVQRSSPPSNFLVGSSQSFVSELHQKLQAPQHNNLATSPPSSSFSSSAPASIHGSQVDIYHRSSIASASSTSSSLSTIESDDDIDFPKYGDDSSSDHSEDLDRPSSPRHGSSSSAQSSSSERTPTNTPDHNLLSVDDTALREEPVRQVDYLSHEWREQDIWSSWRYIVSQRKFYGERSRLENASWRTWAKQKHKLRTVTPETLNW